MVTFAEIQEPSLKTRNSNSYLGANGKRLCYSIKLLDLDAKQPFKLINYARRIQEAVDFVNNSLVVSRTRCEF